MIEPGSIAGKDIPSALVVGLAREKEKANAARSRSNDKLSGTQGGCNGQVRSRPADRVWPRPFRARYQDCQLTSSSVESAISVPQGASPCPRHQRAYRTTGTNPLHMTAWIPGKRLLPT